MNSKDNLITVADMLRYLAGHEKAVEMNKDLVILRETAVDPIAESRFFIGKFRCFFEDIGNGKVMDNVDCGGMAAPVDIETGVIAGVGANKAGETYEIHPMTGKKIPGTQIPYWEEAKKMCLEAMQIVPQVRFVAWDVAITPDGPVFIEGNSFPSHAIPQFAAHFPDGIGIIHFCGGAELDFLRITAAGNGSRIHFRPDPGDIFSDGHGLSLHDMKS